MALLDKPTINAITQLLLDALNSIEGLQTGPGSVARIEAQSFSQIVFDIYRFIEKVLNNTTPYNADLDGLIVWGLVLGLPRKEGVAAARDQSLLITGQSPGGQAIPANTILQSQGLLQYKTLSLVSTPGVSPFQIAADIAAVEPGTAGNLLSGDKLTFVSTIPGVNPTADVILDIDNGRDLETEGDWRDRLILAFREKFGGGRRSDYELWAGQVDWVDSTKIWIYPQKPSSNSVGIVALKSGTRAAMIPTTVERDELLAFITERKPVTDDLVWISIQDVGSDKGLNLIHSETTVSLSPGFQPDWERPPAGITLASFNASTNVVTTNETLPDSFQAGDLFTLVTADVTELENATGKMTRVAARLTDTTFTAQTTEGTTVFDHTPVATDEIWPGSLAMQNAREQILNGITDPNCQTVGKTPLNKLGPANPGKKYGDWVSDIKESDISSLSEVTGIANAVTDITGATDPIGLLAIEFPFPNFTKVQLLIPGQVWVHA